MRIILLFLISLSFLYFYGIDDNSNRNENDFEFETYSSSRKIGTQDSILKTYTSSIVKDSVLMDKIIFAVDEIYNNDSLYNLIKNEYFPYWNRNKKYVFFLIAVRNINCIETYGSNVNEKLVAQDLDKTILNRQAISISVMLSFHDSPYGRYYTEYKNNQYYFDNTYLITPTSQTWQLTEPYEYDIRHLYNFLTLNFIYHKGKLYLNPVNGIWNCYE